MNEAPHDLAAEKAVLGACLLDPEAVYRVRRLRAEDFFAPRNGILWQIITGLADCNQPIDAISVSDAAAKEGGAERVGGVAYLAELVIDTPTSVSVEHYATIVSGHAIRRRLMRSHEVIQQLAVRTDIGPMDAVARAVEAVTAAGDTGTAATAVSLAQAAKETWEAIEAWGSRSEATQGVLTGFTAIDNATQGLQPGELTLLAARPSVGKSSLAMDIALNAARRGRRTVFHSLEMTKLALTTRVYSRLGHVDSWRIRSGHLTSEEYSRLARAADQMAELPLAIDETSRHTIPSMTAFCRQHKARNGLDFVVVDYLQLLAAMSKNNRVEQVSELSQGLKQLARALNVPVLALSQLSRDSERDNREPRLSDLRDSGSLEQDADVVILLSRKRGEDGPERETLVSIAKNRNGPIANVRLMFDPATTSFSEAAVGGA